VYMSEHSADGDDLTRLLAERTGRDAEDIAAGAADFEIEDPADADWEPLEEDWDDSPAHQEY